MCEVKKLYDPNPYLRLLISLFKQKLSPLIVNKDSVHKQVNT